MPRKAILLHLKDDVATALTPLSKGEAVTAALDQRSVDVVLRENVPFGHKFALREIGKGEEILKYGLPIGKALSDIHAGEWVSIHNCRSDRWGFHNEKYGIQA